MIRRFVGHSLFQKKINTINRMIQARDLVVGNMYQLADTERIRFSSPSYLQRLLARHHLLIEKEPSYENSFHLTFQTDNIGEFSTINPTFWVFEDQYFLPAQKSLTNVYKNKGTEFGVRNIFERAGMTGYNPAANVIVKQATGVKYTPNPYLPGGKRKTRKSKSTRRHSKRTRKH
jgi:hypothetical protein